MILKETQAVNERFTKDCSLNFADSCHVMSCQNSVQLHLYKTKPKCLIIIYTKFLWVIYNSFIHSF